MTRYEVATETLSNELRCENQTNEFEVLYEKSFPFVARYIAGNGGTLDDAKDIFHDAIVIYYENKLLGKINIAHSEDAYVFGIAKHLWSKQFKVNIKQLDIEHADHIKDLANSATMTMNESKLLNMLEQTGKRCLELLVDFYYNHKSLKVISKTLGFSNDHAAAVQKYKCIEKMREQVKTKSIAYEDFFE